MNTWLKYMPPYMAFALGGGKKKKIQRGVLVRRQDNNTAVYNTAV